MLGTSLLSFDLKNDGAKHVKIPEVDQSGLHSMKALLSLLPPRSLDSNHIKGDPLALPLQKRQPVCHSKNTQSISYRKKISVMPWLVNICPRVMFLFIPEYGLQRKFGENTQGDTFWFVKMGSFFLFCFSVNFFVSQYYHLGDCLSFDLIPGSLILIHRTCFLL